MPQHGGKHQQEQPLELLDFTGGLNVGVPASMIEDNECQVLTNFYLDPMSGKPRTRYPLVRHSSSAPSAGAGAVDSLYYWNSTWFMSVNQTLYYLDSNKDPVSLGLLNSNSPPVYCPYNNKLIVASGGTLQYTDTTPSALADVSNAPTATFCFEKHGRVISGGDTTNIDRISASNFHDETAWTGSVKPSREYKAGSAESTGPEDIDDDYADVGWKDKLTVVGMTEFAEGLYLVFKTSDSEYRSYFLTELDESYPRAKLVSSSHAAITHRAIVGVLDRLLFMEKHNVASIVGTDRQGKIIVDSNPGLKLGSSFAATTSAFAVVYPRDYQVWFIPDPTEPFAYIYHYTRRAWSKFDFTKYSSGSATGSYKIHSAFYLPGDGYLYLGCDDGYIYKYDHSDIRYQDYDGTTRTDYKQSLRTKVYDISSRREQVVKRPLLHLYELFGTGSSDGTLYLKDNYGRTVSHSEAFDISNPYIYTYDTQGKGVVRGTDQLIYECSTAHTSDTDKKPVLGADWADYWVLSTTYDDGATWVDGKAYLDADRDNATWVFDTRQGGTGERFTNPSAGSSFIEFDENKSVDNIQFQVDIDSGAAVIEKITADVAFGQRKN